MSPLVLFFTSPPVPVLILWWRCRVRRWQLISQLLSCSIGFFFFFFFSFFKQGLGIYISFDFHNLRSIISIYSLTVFHISFSWWSFTEDWVTASLLKSPGLFFRILSDHNNVVVWLVSTRSLVSVPRTPNAIGIRFTFMFKSFLVNG